MKLQYIYLLALLVIGFVAFLLYAIDKSRAKRRAWRIKESLLLGIGFFGGAAGALLAMRVIRHKTKHWYFWAVNILGLLWQLILLGFLFMQK
jgi:uncharacterized membrane protein YsdA (DUF1294 family)